MCCEWLQKHPARKGGALQECSRTVEAGDAREGERGAVTVATSHLELEVGM